MQLTSLYLLNTRVDLIINTTGYVVEYTPVHKKQLKLFKGIDNQVQFRVLNVDQKPVDISTYTPTIMVYDASKMLVIRKTGVVQDDGVDTFKKGLFTVEFTENEMLNLSPQYMSYSVYLTDSSSKRILTYSNDHHGNNGTIILSDEVMPEPIDTIVVDTFIQTGLLPYVYTTEAAYANPGINGNSALHTVAFYVNEFVGSVSIQGTLSSNVDDTTTWSDITEVEFTGEETTPVVKSFNGMFNFIRFKTDDDPANITKILIRN